MRDLIGAYYAATLPGPEPHPIPGYEIDEACWPDAERLAAAMDVPLEVIVERFRGGDRAWVAWCFLTPDGRDLIAGWLWVSVSEHADEPTGRLLRFPADTAYVWSAGVRVRHQNKGLFTALLETAGAQMLNEGHEVMWLGAEDGNRPSRAAAERAGFRRVLNVSVRDGEFSVSTADGADLDHVTRAYRMLGLEDC